MSIENYGYISCPADWKEGDELLSENGQWYPCSTTVCPIRRRRIQAGEGYRILGLDEKIPHDCQFLYERDLTYWHNSHGAFEGETVRVIVDKLDTQAIAIRIPVEQEVKKDGKYPLPLSIKEAQRTRRCRYCGQLDTASPGNALALNYGEEYAHELCIPPLPAQLERSKEDELWLTSQAAQSGFANPRDVWNEAWHASRAAMKGEKV